MNDSNIERDNVIRFPVERTMNYINNNYVDEITEYIAYTSFNMMEEEGIFLNDDEEYYSHMTMCFESIKSLIFFAQGKEYPLQSLTNEIFSYSIDDDPQLEFNFDE